MTTSASATPALLAPLALVQRLAWCWWRVCLTAATLVVAFASCHDGPTAPTTGALSVTITGLPAGVTPSVTVSGPGGYTLALDSSARLSALPLGSYTVVASDVLSGGTRYAPVPAGQTLVVSGGAVTSARVDYSAATARLVVSVTGLPSGTQAAVSVTGPGGFSRTLTATTGLDLLSPGTYVITAPDVMAAGRTYHASSVSQSIVLAASETPVTATVAYAVLALGSINLTIAGLPPGVSASVTITAPDGSTSSASASSVFPGLPAGSYTVSASAVAQGVTTYTPSPASQVVVVTDGVSGSVTVTYTGADLQLGLQQTASGLTSPVYLTAPAGDPRLFIVERNGRIRIVKNGSLLAAPFLDISSRVYYSSDYGLFSIAFDPQYATNGFFYAYYSAWGGNLVIEKFNSIPGSDTAGESAGTVLAISGGESHVGGQIAFGLDGMLYAAPGDGNPGGDAANSAQNLGSMFGKMLRIDVRTFPYVIPPDNPFVGVPGLLSEVWARGLRNPWRFSFDSPTGMLYIGDVGEISYEEINVVPSAAPALNYGWRLMEGPACYNPGAGCNSDGSLTLPVFSYPHPDGCAVMGGYVYRGSGIPEIRGYYFYADLCGTWLRSFRLTGGVATDQRTWAGISISETVSFGQDAAGELYVIGSGSVSRIVRR